MKLVLKYLNNLNIREKLAALTNFDMQIVYLISLISTVGSLSTSQVFGWSPFTLAFLQRAFMYPIVAISAFSILLNNRKYLLSSLLLAVMGLISSIIHYFTLKNTTLIGCGFALPCSTESRIILLNSTIRPIHLPLMAMISFLTIIIVNLFNTKDLEDIIKLLSY